MSCEQNTNKVSRLICMGLTHLASKRAFFAGLAVGSVGLAGTAKVLAKARRQSDLRQNQSQLPSIKSMTAPPILLNTRQIPRLQARPRLMPATKIGVTHRCETCRTPWGSKPGAWYPIGSHVYCPDCAPNAANSLGIDLSAPVPVMTNIPIRGVKGAEPVVVSHRNPTTVKTKTPVVSGSIPMPNVLPAEKIVATKLASAPIRICLTRRTSGAEQDSDVVVQSGFVVLREDSQDTGLAITPAIILPSQPGETIRENLDLWNVVHINSGTTMTGSKPFRTVEDAQKLVSILAQLDWTLEEGEILKRFNLDQINATITVFREAVEKRDQEIQRQAMTTTDTATSTVQPRATTVSPASDSGNDTSGASSSSLVGKIVADRYGGIGRVLSDDGQFVLLVDSIGERYELDKEAVFSPTEADYDVVRVAMPTNAKRRHGDKCSNCERPTETAQANEKWFRMNKHTFCPTCAKTYAAEQQFTFEEEIGKVD